MRVATMLLAFAIAAVVMPVARAACLTHPDVEAVFFGSVRHRDGDVNPTHLSFIVSAYPFPRGRGLR